MRKPVITLAALAVLRVSADAQVYKWVLPDGTIQYSDRPQPDAKQVEEVKLAPLQTYDGAAATPRNNQNQGSKPATPAFAGYEDFKVASPANDVTIRDNGGSVSVSLSLSPALQPGHTVDILMGSEEELDPQLQQMLSLIAAPEGADYRVGVSGDF